MANDFAQTTANARPFIAAADLNGLDVVDFQGSEWLIGPDIDNIWTHGVDEDSYVAIVFAVITYVNSTAVFSTVRSTSNMGLFGVSVATGNTRITSGYTTTAGSQTSVAAINPGPTTGTYVLLEAIRDSGTITWYYNGAQTVQVTDARVLILTGSDQGQEIGLASRRDGLAPSTIRVAELVIANQVPNAADRAAYHDWVRTTYGLTIQ